MSAPRLLSESPGVPLGECLRKTPDELAAHADELVALGHEMGVDLPDEERALLPAQGYDVQAALAQANAAALGRSRDAQEGSGVTPQQLDDAADAQRGMLAVQAGAAQLAADADDGLRFLQALQGYGCQQVLDWIEAELASAPPEAADQLAGLAAPLKDYLARQAQQAESKAAAADRKLAPLHAEAEAARAEATAMKAVADVAEGWTPDAETLELAAARVAPAAPASSALEDPAALRPDRRAPSGGRDLRDRRGAARPAPRGGKRRT